MNRREAILCIFYEHWSVSLTTSPMGLADISARYLNRDKDVEHAADLPHLVGADSAEKPSEDEREDEDEDTR